MFYLLQWNTHNILRQEFKHKYLFALPMILKKTMNHNVIYIFWIECYVEPHTDVILFVHDNSYNYQNNSIWGNNFHSLNMI